MAGLCLLITNLVRSNAIFALFISNLGNGGRSRTFLKLILAQKENIIDIEETV